MDKIIFPIKNELNEFENKLKKVVLSEDNFLTCDLEKFIFSKPKRLRPIFIFLFAKILKIDSPLVLDIALITELIHSASLIHDDIIDEEKIRRNTPTFFEKYGSKLAVLEGDMLLAFALEKISNTTLDISKIFANRIKRTLQGEISQNEDLNKIVDIEKYYKKTYEKTANLFIAGLEALFTLEAKNDNLLKFIEKYALAFQIKNDVDNFKNTKTDIKNGNYTLPMIYSSMENNSENIDEYIKKAQEKVEELKKDSIDELKNIEDSQYKKSLIELVNYSLRS